MSSKSTIIWLLVAVILGAAALLLLRSPGGRNSTATAILAIGDRPIQIDPTKLKSIAITSGDGGTEQIDRGAAGEAEWTMLVRPAGAVDSGARPAWPVPASRVQALLRHLNDVQVRATAEKDASLGSRLMTVTVTRSDGGPVVLRLAEQSVAGKALIEVEDPARTAAGKPATVRALVDDTIHLLFRDHAAREWRDRTALYGAGLDASRINLENDKGVTLALGKVEGAWSVREPMSAPGDPSAVQRLLSAVIGVQIVDFLDQGVPAASTRLDKPIAKLVIETDRREPAPSPDQPGAIVADSHQLEIGGAADAGGTRLFARVDGERTVVIDARAVAELKLEPGLYVWPFPTRLNPADIGTIAIERADPNAAVPGSVYRRSLERWKQIRADGQEVLLAETDSRPVTALLGFLCGPSGPTPPPAPGTPPLGPTAITAAAPEGLRSLGRITLLSLSGAPLDTLEIGAAKPGSVIVRTGPIYRTFSLDRAPSLIVEFTQTMTPASTAKDATSVPDDGK
jgi:hypothetical protein